MLACALRLFQIPRVASPPKEIDMTVGQACPGRGKVRIDLDRALEHLSRELDALARPFVIKLTSAKIRFVCFDVRRGGLQETEFLSFGERQTQRFQNASGNLVLNCEDVFNLAIEA